jgi:Leucine-rich repeat (LRR) protein
MTFFLTIFPFHFQLNLRNNKISFITRKMFPANPWIPYRLERVDLSHNLIPVLTFDITIGTKKLKYLNLSNNAIKDIRKFVIGNLTSLETLDLSDNQLTNLEDPDAPFILPENITNLYLQNNELFKLDYKQITKLKNIKEVNLENNQLMHLNKSLIDEIKAGVSVKFAGNPLICNCEIQSLKHFLLAQESPPAQYSQLVCQEPKHISGVILQDVEDKQLTCSEIEKSNIEDFNHEYEKLPDIRFRDILL